MHNIHVILFLVGFKSDPFCKLQSSANEFNIVILDQCHKWVIYFDEHYSMYGTCEQIVSRTCSQHHESLLDVDDIMFVT